MNDQVRALWARVKLQVHPEQLQLVSLPLQEIPVAAEIFAREAMPFAAVVKEPGGVSLTISEQTWLANRARFPDARASGPYRAITLDLEVEPSTSGFFAPAAARLAAIGVSIVPQCGYRRDHLLVPASDAGRAVDALGDLVRDCGRSAGV